MEVKINIESNQIGETVVDLFKNLSEEKKEELASEVVKNYLNERVNQKVTWSETLISEINKKIDNYFAEDLKNNVKFQESKDKCIELLINELPEMTTKAMTIVIANQLGNMAYKIPEIVMKTMNIDAKLNEVRSRMGLNY
jgi:molybdopterin converting factor small subunit